ncbi:DUF4421 domain-containing protein [Oligoflexaceae bacterium]|nr:DUF4421 domain-containing protein [Oligoflexaceae bacterium]
MRFLTLVFIFVVLPSSIALGRRTYRTSTTSDAQTLRFAHGYSTTFFLLGANSNTIAAAKEEGREIESFLKFEPNITRYTAISYSNKYFGVGLSIPNKNSKERMTSRGTSKADDYSLSLGFESASLAFFHQDYRGMHITEPNEHPEVDGIEVFPQFKDMRLLKQGFNFDFKFSPTTLSLGSLDGQTEVQNKSGGSWIARISGNSIQVTNGGQRIIPDTYAEISPLLTDAVRIQMKDITVSAGYGYNWIPFSSFYLGGMITQGLSFSRGEYTLISGETHSAESNLLGGLSLLASLGYNSEEFFSGLSFNLDRVISGVGDTTLTATNNNFEIFVGWRF